MHITTSRIFSVCRLL